MYTYVHTHSSLDKPLLHYQWLYMYIGRRPDQSALIMKCDITDTVMMQSHDFSDQSESKCDILSPIVSTTIMM